LTFGKVFKSILRKRRYLTAFGETDPVDHYMESLLELVTCKTRTAKLASLYEKIKSGEVSINKEAIQA